MNIMEVKERTNSLIKDLTWLWEKSVQTTHLFLSKSGVAEIKECMPDALWGIDHLIIVEDEDGSLAAFMGIKKQRIEMLFVAPTHQKKGLGRKLILFGIEKYSANELTVSEQNPIARRFYESMGFKVYGRTDHDEQGRPYPILYMHLCP